jgi:NADH-quinone oxidoreductase subunit N
MVLGNLVALTQPSLKRMLAYSSIAHAGYLLVAVWAGSPTGAGAVLLYLLAYALTTLASFGFVALLGRGGERSLTNDDLAGLSVTRPGVALGLSICMLSLLGFPGTFGFIGKWYIISATVAEGQYILPVILVLTSVLSAGYYLPVIMAMYMRPLPTPTSSEVSRFPRAAAGAIAVSVLLIVVLGFWPRELLDLAGQSAATLTQTGRPLASP